MDDEIGDLALTGMDRLQSMEPLSELWRKPSIRLCLVGKQCVASCNRSIQQVQKGCSRWLFLVGHVGVPRY